MIALLLGSCAPPVLPPTPAPETSALVALSAPELLRRMSLDLRGVLPTIEELDAAEADPAQLNALRDAMLDDPRHEERLIEVFGERFLTLLDEFEVRYFDYHLSELQEFEYERSVGEEPLRLMARVAITDTAWSEIVTADWTMANELLAEIWPIAYPADASGWQMASYTDLRPAAGVLATNGMWWRYVTNPSNMNRGRVAAIMRLLLCQDVLSRPVSFSGSVTLDGGTTDAMREQDACVACHSSIEPMASSLFGFYWYTQYNAAEMTRYHSEREPLGHLDGYLGVEPAYFGTPIAGLVELGQQIALDHRFERCAAEGAAEMFWRREVTRDDFDTIEALRSRFVDGGQRYRALLIDITDSEEYRAGGVTDAASEAVVERERTTRLMNAPLLASSLEDLTGFRWTFLGFDQLSNDDLGVRSLAGGVDGDNVTAPQADPGLTWALTAKRVAEGAAAYAVGQELTLGADGVGMLRYVTTASVPGDEAFTQEIEALHWRLYAQRPDAEWVAQAGELWSSAFALSDTRSAWSSLVAAMLRDPAFVGY